MRSRLILALCALLGAPAALAEVLGADAGAFSTRTQVTIAAPPGRVYERLLKVGSWWSDEHTYSGAARNMRLQARPGGCWCEALEKGGFIEHGRVVYAQPGRNLRLDSALGPLHEVGGSGSLDVRLEPEGSGTKLTLTYVGQGFDPKNGFASMARLFDGVFAEQLRRLKRLVETGRATDTPEAR
jgi:uncharacterized protein YndB with AHSA1/START domain